MPIRYSIIVPAYREAAIIRTTLQRLAGYLEQEGHATDTEVIVVVAEGGDATVRLAAGQKKLFHHFRLIETGPRAGKGRDVRVGMLAARGDFALFTDADLATPEQHIFPAFTRLDEGADIVIGVRRLTRIHRGLRMLISLGSNLLTRLLILPTISDTQCGFKAFTKDAIATIFPRQTILGWGFDMELLVIARIHRLRIRSMRIGDWHDPKSAHGIIGGDDPLGAALQTFGELWRIRVQAWRGIYR